MILLLVGGLLLDQRVDGMTTPAWARDLLPTLRETWPPGTVLLVISLVVSVLAARELAALLASDGVQASKRMITFASMLGLLVSCLVPAALPAPLAVAVVSTSALAVLVTAMVFHSRHKTVEGVIAATGGVLLGFVYLGLMFGFLLAIRREHHSAVLLWVLLTTKACDIGAYFTGKSIGRHKLIPWLSPGKTWEGLAGGLALSGAIGALGLGLVGLWAGVVVPHWWQGALLGVVLGAAGQAGDLLESILKRDAGSKDSGTSIPGFGGVLDVLDSPLLAAPVAYWWLLFMMRQGYFAPGAGGS
jgi:phosphatidate cytidylyltransferase